MPTITNKFALVLASVKSREPNQQTVALDTPIFLELIVSVVVSVAKRTSEYTTFYFVCYSSGAAGSLMNGFHCKWIPIPQNAIILPFSTCRFQFDVRPANSS